MNFRLPFLSLLAALLSPLSAHAQSGPGPGPNSIIPGTTIITGGPCLNGQVLFNNAGYAGCVSSSALSISIGSPIASSTVGYGLYVNSSNQLGQFAFGMNVFAALGNPINAASGLVGYSGALGTPTSGVATNLTGLPLSTGVTGTLQAAQFPALTGDVTTTAGALAATLATVNSNVGSYGSTTAIPNITVNGKGLITAASTSAVVAPAGTLTGATLASGVTASSLTSVGTLVGGATGSGFTVALSTSTLTGQVGLTNLPSLSANTVFGALTATTPSGLAVPSCSGASSALTWTSGTGFGCNTIYGTVTSVSVTTANGVSGTVSLANPAIPAITLALAAITPTSVAIGAGSAITSSGPGGALGTNAFSSTAYAPLASPTFTGVVTIPNGGVFGTPTSATLTNATGLPLSTGVTGVLGFVNGGTGLSALGTGNQCLTTNAGATAMVWAACGASGSGTVTSVTPGNGLVSSLTASCSQSAITASGTLSAAKCVNAQTGTTYAILDGDRAKLVTAANTAAQAYSIAQAGNSSAFQAGWFSSILNESSAPAGVVTITPATSTINGAATLALPQKFAAIPFSDGTNYQAIVVPDPTVGYYDQGSVTNCTLVGTVSANALTVALKTRSGADPSAALPCMISFRNATAATGDYTAVPVTAATSFVTGTSGSTFGSTNGAAFRLWITAWNNAGTVVLGVSKQSTASQIFSLNEGLVQSSTACNACTNAATAGVFYTTAAQTSKAIRTLGYMEWGSGLATAGTWASGPTNIQLMGPGVKKPGDVMQTIQTTIGSASTTVSTTYVTTGLSQAIVPTSAANLVEAEFYGCLQASTISGEAMASLFRGSTQIGLTNQAYGTVYSISMGASDYLDAPATTSSTTYSVQQATGSASSTAIFGCTASIPGPINGLLMLKEIQGAIAAPALPFTG